MRRLNEVGITRYTIAYVIISLLAIGMHLYATRPWGIGVTQDSVFYFSAADNLLKGHGVSWTGGGGAVKPLIHFPPLYPITVSVFKAILGQSNLAANWINALLFGLNVPVIGLIIQDITKSRLAGLAGAFIALISPVIFGVHLDAMSEPLYLIWVFVSLGLLVLYLDQRKIPLAIVAGLCSGLAVLTRYVGISVIATGVLMLVLWYPAEFKRRLWEAIRYGIVATVPVIIWYIRNLIHTGSFTNRSISFHPITSKALSEGFNSYALWFLSESASPELRLLVALLVLLGISWILTSIFLNKGTSGQIVVPYNTRIIGILVLHVVVYSLLLIFSISFIDASTRLENRILLPIYFIILILAVVSINWLLSTPHWRAVGVKHFLGLSAVAFVALLYVPRQVDLIENMRDEGRGFSAQSWTNSEIISALKRLDPETTVYSNEAFSVLYLTGIPARWIPEKFDPVKAIERVEFAEQMEKMRNNMAQPESVMAVFHQGYLKAGMPELDEIMEGLVIVHESRDGIILVSPGNVASWSYP